MLAVVYINLDRDIARRESMEQQLTQIGLPWCRKRAVWWADIPLPEQQVLYSAALNARQYHQPLVNGEKGCYTSHLEVWEALLESSDPAWVVLEDDVTLAPEFESAIAAIEQLVPTWDIVKLIGRDQEKVRSQRLLPAGFTLVEYQRIPSSTAGYVISRTGAAKLVVSRKPFGRPVDVDLRHWWENDMRVYGIIPAALMLNEVSQISSIEPKQFTSSLMVKWRKFLVKFKYSWFNSVKLRQIPHAFRIDPP